MKIKYYLTVVIVLLCLPPTPLSAQTPVNKTIPNENDLYTEYYILEEHSDSTACYLYLFETTHSYMLIVNYHIAPELTRSYFLSQGEYTDTGHEVFFRDDVNNLVMTAKRDDADDLVFEQGLDFMTGETFLLTEKTSQLPGPPYIYNIFSEKRIQAAIDKAKTTETNEKVGGCRYQTKMFSDHILADLQLNEDRTFSFHFMHYPLMRGRWEQENLLVMLTSEPGGIFYGSVHPGSLNFSVIQLPGFIFEAHDNHLLYKYNPEIKNTLNK